MWFNAIFCHLPCIIWYLEMRVVLECFPVTTPFKAKPSCCGSEFFEKIDCPVYLPVFFEGNIKRKGGMVIVQTLARLCVRNYFSRRCSALGVGSRLLFRASIGLG